MLGHVALEVSKNLLKGAFPTLVTRLRRHTGRGKGRQTAGDILAYARGVVEGHLSLLGFRDPARELAGKTVVELGPGDTLATGLVLLAYGAKRYYAVDRFAFDLESEKNQVIYALLLESLPAEAQERLAGVLERSGSRLRLDPNRARVVREPAESFRLPEPADLLLSQSVLEHVLELDAVFGALAAALKPGGRMSHSVDLRDHDLYPGEPFRFLTFSPRLWAAMHCFRGSPNRERSGRYRELLDRHGFALIEQRVTTSEPPEAVAAARPRLDPAFRSLPEAELQVMAFRFTAAKR